MLAFCLQNIFAIKIYKCLNNTASHVFLKYKDALGNSKRWFVGLYRCGGYDINKHVETWEYFSETSE